MRGIAVEIQSHAHESHLNHQERHEHIAPEIEVQNSVQEIEIHRLTYTQDNDDDTAFGIQPSS